MRWRTEAGKIDCTTLPEMDTVRVAFVKSTPVCTHLRSIYVHNLEHLFDTDLKALVQRNMQIQAHFCEHVQAHHR